MATAIPETLLRAQQLSLSRDERIDTLSLDAVKKGVPNLNVANSIVSATATLTIEGASTLEIGIHDPNWIMESSGLLDVGDDGRMLAINVRVDRLTFRLCQATRKDPDVLTLVFEDEVVALLRTHNKYLAASRGSMTRAQFIRSMVQEIKARDILFFAPERSVKQPVKSPQYPDTVPAHGDSGFDQGASFKIAGHTADAAQMRQVATAMGVADQEGASAQVILAMLVAGIGESSFRAVPNSGGSNYWGVFQGSKDVWKIGDTAGMARSFLRGGKGFQAGGAIQAHRDHPEWSAGTIAYKVEGDRSNFGSDAEAEHFYQQWHSEAKAIASLWQSGSPTSLDAQGNAIADSKVLRSKEYQFTRGTIDKRENSWVAGQRLADEVRWRLYDDGGLIVFATDDYLISKPASLILDGPYATGLLGPPTYDFDHGKLQHQVDLSAVANRWAVRPGEVVVLTHMGPITGRWIVETAEFDLLDATQTKITLIKPLEKLKEPAHEVSAGGGSGTTRSTSSGGDGTYSNPIGAGLVTGRIDMGVDFTGKGAIKTIGRCEITRAAPQNSGTGWPGEGDAGRGNRGAMIVYRLLDGTHKNKYVYLAENIDAIGGLKTGDVLDAGQTYAHARGAFPFLEIGWAANGQGRTLAAATTGYSEGEATAAGKDFMDLLRSLGVK